MFGGPNLDEIFLIAARVSLNAYGGELIEYREQDRVFFKIEGLNACGYDTPRVCLGENFNCQ